MLKSLQLCFHLPCTRFKYNSSSVLVFGCQQQATVSWFLVVGHRHNRDGRSIITMNTVYIRYVPGMVLYDAAAANWNRTHADWNYKKKLL